LSDTSKPASIEIENEDSETSPSATAEAVREDPPASVPPNDSAVDVEPSSQAAQNEESEDAPLATVLSALNERIEESQRLLTRQLTLADRLHEENQRLRSGELRGALMPLVRDLIRLNDNIGQLLQGDSDDRGDGSEALEIVLVALLDALARNGVTSFMPEVGDQFEPKLHSVAGVIDTSEIELNRSIAEVVRAGFRWDDGQLVRVADVRVRRHIPADDGVSADT
jgi:molecular chaperone GrpE (heat shock protein)